jgi:putative transposase
VTFIDEHKDRADGGLRWGVESIYAVPTQHDVKIAPSTYYDARGRQPSPRAVSDERWKPIILTTWHAQRKVLGARKLWLRLRRDGHDIARCTVERLMRDIGIAGVIRGKRKRPVDADPRETRPADLVDRHFARFRTNQLWVADFTYVWTWSGWVYVAFVFDAHSRRIIGWRAATSMTTPLVLDCLEMALWTRRREGVAGFAGLTHHTDAGSVGGFNWLSQHLNFGGVSWRESVGVSGTRIVRFGRRWDRTVAPVSISAACSVSSGSGSPQAWRARPRPPRSACRHRSGRGGSATVAACHRSV